MTIVLNSAKIYHNVDDLRKHFNTFNNASQRLYKSNPTIVATSGGFDPLHRGHLRCIMESSKLGDVLVVIVNGDGFLIRKKGRPFMTLDERMEIISGIKGVDYVVSWDDGSQTVTGCIEKLKPNIFTKGGDRSDKSVVPEFEMCGKIGCDVIFNIGGAKIQSSSELISGSNKRLLTDGKLS